MIESVNGNPDITSDRVVQGLPHRRSSFLDIWIFWRLLCFRIFSVEVAAGYGHCVRLFCGPEFVIACAN